MTEEEKKYIMQPRTITRVGGKKYIEWIKEKDCLVCGVSGVDADHLKTIGMGGDRKKPHWEDYTCVPLCRHHHIERHTNWEKFEKKYRINLWKEAFRLLLRYITLENDK